MTNNAQPITLTGDTCRRLERIIRDGHVPPILPVMNLQAEPGAHAPHLRYDRDLAPILQTEGDLVEVDPAVLIHNGCGGCYDCAKEVLVETGLQFLPSGHRDRV